MINGLNDIRTIFERKDQMITDSSSVLRTLQALLQQEAEKLLPSYSYVEASSKTPKLDFLDRHIFKYSNFELSKPDSFEYLNNYHQSQFSYQELPLKTENNSVFSLQELSYNLTTYRENYSIYGIDNIESDYNYSIESEESKLEHFVNDFWCRVHNYFSPEKLALLDIKLKINARNKSLRIQIRKKIKGESQYFVENYDSLSYNIIPHEFLNLPPPIHIVLNTIIKIISIENRYEYEIQENFYKKKIQDRTGNRYSKWVN